MSAAASVTGNGRPDYDIPPLAGRHVMLRPVTVQDHEALRHVEVSGELVFRWRFRGATPSPEQWARLAWNSVLAQFLVVSRSEKRPIGLVMLYRPSFEDRHAYLAVVRFEERQLPLLMIGTALFLDYAFACWDFNKLYMEVPEYNLGQFRSALRRLFKVEARMKDHSYFAGRRWDELILALYRSTWKAERGPIIAMAGQPPPDPAQVFVPLERRAR